MYEGVPLCIEPPTPAAHVARDVGCGLGALLVLCLGVLCFRVKQRRWWWRATCGRFSRALLPHVEMVASTTKTSLASQDAMHAMAADADAEVPF